MVMGMPTDSSCESMLARGMPAKSCPGGTGTTSGAEVAMVCVAPPMETVVPGGPESLQPPFAQRTSQGLGEW